ncbi:hypothetical protein HIM_07790 [Hirsutella minnesotensis 3608]|uniref:Uncharacterized protein n=1 Tax=Hirsutella minnesotensis 3608 TaxID=1043627 RepID=A0A0F7ZHL4_9HYPO|nr:hypothetical protein HIM_07790 [Hirsutella minnesotensis 3608]
MDKIFGSNERQSENPPDRCLLLNDSRSTEEYQDLIPIWDDRVVKIGRNPQSSFCISDDPGYLVSREHCEVYVVVYDEATSHVYVRDRNSSNGTFVNNVRMESRSNIAPGFLLQHGDMIEIRPYWTFTFCDKRPPKRHPLTTVQEMESQLFQEKYEISERCLGRGAEGVVYMATEVGTKRQLICKVVDLKEVTGSDGAEQVRRKLQEADVLRQLQHPNILAFVDAFISPYSLYVASSLLPAFAHSTRFTFAELATGGDLWSFIYQRDSIGELETRVIVRQVVNGLDYIHQKGVVHRDLKPENILLACSPRSTCLRVMLSDFGAYAVPRRSRMLTQMGTVNYQAPEIQSQAQAQTAAVDIWSLGVVTLTLLTHHLGIQLIGLDRLDSQQLHQYLVHEILQTLENLSLNGRNFITNCLRIKPVDRINAAEARVDDWLCKPKAHMSYFRELERRSLRSWKQHNQLRPMPLYLPDVTKQTSQEDNNLGLGSMDDLENKPEKHQTQQRASPYFAFPAPSKAMASKPQEPSPPGSSSTPQAPSSTLATRSNGLIGGPPEQTLEAGRVASLQEKQRGGKARDVTPQPWTNLKKRSNGSRKACKDRRRLVIEELKRANVKFLPEIPEA